MLRAQWQRTQEQPRIPVGRTAVPGRVSEAELLAKGCGKRVTRLCGLRDLIKALPQLGRVKAVTINRQVVHEKVGRYQTIKLLGSQGCVRGDRINLRLFLNHWHYGFAVKEKCDDGFRYSLQFFDRDGTAVHKVYLTDFSHWEAYQNLVARYRSADQRPRQSVAPVPRLPARLDGEVDVIQLRRAWLGLQDIHDLPALFRSFGISRIQGLRLVGEDLAAPIPLPDLPILMEAVREVAFPVKFYVGNPGVMQIHRGRIEKLGTAGLWHTVLDADSTLYVRETGVSQAWIVRQGTRASLELYNGVGENILQIFTQCQPRQAEYEIWQYLLAPLETA